MRGVFHCFTGDAAYACRALDLGFHVSFSGIVTFRNANGDSARRLRSFQRIDSWRRPTRRICRPSRTAAARSEPARVAQVIDTLSDVHGVERNDVIEATRRSYDQLFAIAA